MEDDNSMISMTDEIERVYLITFILLLTIEIPSILCTIFILIFFGINWYSLMIKILHNHAIFLLIIVSFLYITLDLPFIISHYYLHYDKIRSRAFCLWWYFLDYTLLTTSLFLTATASIQRHILVFNTRWLHGPRKRWILHYIPLIFCLSYPLFFYFIVTYFSSCETFFHVDYIFCPFPCYTNDSILFYIDWILNVISPVLIIVVANIALIGRAIHSMDKFRQSQSSIWKKRRKLILQLLAFSTLYLIGWGPSTIISIIQTLFLHDLYDNIPDLYYINNSSYFVCPLQPFICLFAIPELLKFIRKKFQRKPLLSRVPASIFDNTHV